VDSDKHDIGNRCHSWGTSTRVWNKDKNFFWVNDESGEQTTVQTIENEARSVIVNTFAARLNDNRLKGQGGQSIRSDAWFNLTVYFFNDHRGGVFDLRQSGDPNEYITAEAFTLHYLVDAANWPFHRKTDLLGAQITASLLHIESVNDAQLYECPTNGGNSNSYSGEYGYGSRSKSKSSKSSKSSSKSSGKKKKKKKNNDVAGNPFGDNYKGKKSKKSKKKKSKRRRLLSTGTWERNEFPRGNGDDSGWGAFDGETRVFSSAYTSLPSSRFVNYAFVVNFVRESINRAVVDESGAIDIDTANLIATETDVTFVHFFPVFDVLEFNGGSIYYEPTWKYWQTANVTHISSDNGALDSAKYTGGDMNDDPNFKTHSVDQENGFFTELWQALTPQQWIIAVSVVCVAILVCCCACGWIFHKKLQNMHEDDAPYHNIS